MSKWFRGAGDDSEDDESQKSSTEESEENSQNSDSDDSSKSSKSDSSDEESESEKEKKQEENKEKRARFLKGRGDSSDEDSGAEKAKQSGRQKRRQEMITCLKQIREHLQADECSAATDSLEKIKILALKAIKMEGWTVPPRPFFIAILIIEAYAKQFDDEDAREGMSAQHVKELRELRNKAKKHASQFASATDAYRKRLGEDFNWEDELDDEEEDEEDIEDEILPDVGRKETDKEKEKDKIWDTEFAEKKLNEVLAVRGKKGTDREEQVKELNRIFNHTLATELGLRTRIRIHLLSAYLDMTPPQSSFLPREAWQNAYNTLITLLESLHENPHIVLSESEIEEGMDEKVHSINDGKTPELNIQIVGNFVGYAQRLDDEFIKALQFTDPHTGDFVKILQDEAFLMDGLERTLHYYILRKMMKHASRIAARLVAHLYYRRQEAHVQMLAKQRLIAERAKKRTQEAAQADYDAVQGEAQKTESATSPKEDEASKKKSRLDRLERRRREFSVTDDIAECMQRFLPIVLKHNEEKARIKATLENVYHLALHNKYTQARDQLLISHVGDYINGTSINPVFCIAYNRALAQLGLAAFRLGLFRDVHNCLNELCSTQKTKELLAQGLPAQRYNEVRKPEQERADKMRLIPYHMHINLDTLEAAHLVAALIVEVPTLAANPHSKPKIQSKGFNKLLNHYQQQVFLGPPENVRDHVFAAYRAMLEGDWGRCAELVCSIPAWDLVHGNADIKAMLTRRIKDEALRSYLLQYSEFYDTISLEVLATKFDMPANTVHAVVSKMMFNSELSGSWNQPAACIQIHKNTPNKLQYLALQTAEKAQQLVEYNEKMVEYKTGTGGFSQYSKGDGGRQGGRTSEWGGMNRWPFAGQRRVPVARSGAQQQRQQGGYSQGNNRTNDGSRNPFQFRSRNQQQRQQAGGFSSAAGRSATYAQAGQRLGARDA